MSAPVVSSFVRKSQSRVPYIAGSKPSIHNAQLLVSTGVPTIDQAVGGGVAVGTCVIVEEDMFGTYSHLFLKHFLAEGVINKQSVYVASLSRTPDDIIKQLPASAKDELVPAQETGDELRIAWRYKNVMCDQDAAQTFGNYFDVSRTLDGEQLGRVSVAKFGYEHRTDISPQSCIYKQFQSCPSYGALLSSLKSTVESQGFLTDSGPTNILRIGLHSLGSPLWHPQHQGASSSAHHQGGSERQALLRFLLHLRSLLRASYSVCVLTIPSHLFEDAVSVWEMEQLGDTVLGFESFAGSDKPIHPAYKDFQGLFHMVRLPCLNSLQPYQPDTLQYAFKVHRKRFSVEKLYLPPDLSETASREIGKPGPSCSVNTSKGPTSIDF